MTREQAKRLLPIIEAFADGKNIQYKNNSGNWNDLIYSTFVDPIPNFETSVEWRVKPESKLLIAGRQCEFNSDGTVKLSCGTVISNEEIEAFLKNRQEAKESEWPKYFTRFTNEVLRCGNNQDPGEYFSQGVWRRFQDSISLVDFSKNNKVHTPISRAQAAAMIGEENLSK